MGGGEVAGDEVGDITSVISFACEGPRVANNLCASDHRLISGSMTCSEHSFLGLPEPRIPGPRALPVSNSFFLVNGLSRRTDTVSSVYVAMHCCQPTLDELRSCASDHKQMNASWKFASVLSGHLFRRKRD